MFCGTPSLNDPNLTPWVHGSPDACFGASRVWTCPVQLQETCLWKPSSYGLHLFLGIFKTSLGTTNTNYVHVSQMTVSFLSHCLDALTPPCFSAGFRASWPGRASKSCLFHKFPEQNQKGCPDLSSESVTCCLGIGKDQTKSCPMTPMT